MRYQFSAPLFLPGGRLNPAETSRAILRNHFLCSTCLGRQFTHDFPGRPNQEIGRDMADSAGLASDGRECFICHPLREQLAALEKLALELTKDIECRTMLVGVSIPDEIIKREDELRMRYSLLGSESIRRELSREVGKRLAPKLGLEIDFEKPDVTLVFDLNRKEPRVDVQINPVFIFGRYRKLERGLAQTKRYCFSCRGKGCEACLYTGYESTEAIESMVAKELMAAFQGSDWKFHGAGREDVDARMLGNGRPFVLEIIKPGKRTADLSNLERAINLKWGQSIEILDLKYSERREMQRIKTKKFDKTYEVVIAYRGAVGEEAIRALPDKLSGCEVRQQTPLRVMPRRRDIVRRRLVKELRILDVDIAKGRAKLLVRGESGLYVKELMTGDEGRTQPNAKELLGAEAVEMECLDVVKFHDDFG